MYVKQCSYVRSSGIAESVIISDCFSLLVLAMLIFAVCAHYCETSGAGLEIVGDDPLYIEEVRDQTNRSVSS
jgi:hypothetical protein